MLQTIHIKQPELSGLGHFCRYCQGVPLFRANQHIAAYLRQHPELGMPQLRFIWLAVRKSIMLHITKVSIQ